MKGGSEMKRVGINDIATYLDISRNTVSKVMNDRGRVSDNIRTKVIEAAIELGYTKLPEHLLKEHKMSQEHQEVEVSKAKNILVLAIAPDFSTFWGSIINGITNELTDKGFTCLYNFLNFDQEKVFEVPSIIKEVDIAGIIVMNLYNKEAMEKLATTGIPVVYFDIPLGVDIIEMNTDVVVLEGRKSIYKITRQLIEQGDEVLGFIGDTSYCKSIKERWLGFVNAHEYAGLKLHNEYCFTSHRQGHFYFEKETEGAIESLVHDINLLPDAFVCANDVIAQKVIKKLANYGVRVPEDIRISGFDDIFRGDEESQLTSVYIDIHQVGRRLAEQVVWRINNPDREHEVIKICGKIQYRQSTNRPTSLLLG